MSESVFWSLAPEILKLHRQSAYSLFAAGSQIHDAALVNVDGLYYMWLDNAAESLGEAQRGILLIEDEAEHTRISWIATAREVGRRDSVYRRALSALSRRLKGSGGKTGRLVELAPQQGRLTIDNTQDFMISPRDLMRALYPANERMKNFAQ